MERTGSHAYPWVRDTARSLALPVLFAALVSVGGHLRVPIPGNPVPLTMQVVFVLLAGAYLTPASSVLSIALFLGAGVLGAPVFAGGGWGAAYLLGPTGGYLIGFVAAAWCCARILQGRRESLPRVAAAMTAAVLTVHLFGSLHLALYLGGDMGAAIRFTLPFLPGDVLKIAAASAAVAGLSTFTARRDLG